MPAWCSEIPKHAIDRRFRRAADRHAAVEVFKARGVSLFPLDLNGGADDVSGNGIARLFLTIVSAFTEFEADRRIGERIGATYTRNTGPRTRSPSGKTPARKFVTEQNQK